MPRRPNWERDLRRNQAFYWEQKKRYELAITEALWERSLILQDRVSLITLERQIREHYVVNLYEYEWKPLKLNAQQMYQKLVDICADADVDDENPQALAAFWIGDLFMIHVGKFQTGIYWLQKSWPLAANNRLKLYVMSELSRYYIKFSKTTVVRELCERIHQIALEAQIEEYVFEASLRCSDSHILDGNIDAAWKSLDGLKKHLEQFPDDLYFAAHLKSIEGRLYAICGNVRAADQAADNFKKLNDQYFDEDYLVRMREDYEDEDGGKLGSRELYVYERLNSDRDNKLVEYNNAYQSLWDSIEQHLANNELEESEACAADMLQLVEKYEVEERDEVLYYVCLIIEKYHTHGGKLNENGLQMIESFFQFFSLLDKRMFMFRKGSMSIFYRKAGKFDAAADMLEQCLQLYLKDIDKNCEPYSSERISFLDVLHYFFVLLESVLLVMVPSQVKRAIIWTEKQRARDLLYQIDNRFNSHAYVQAMATFDFSVKDAWKEILSVCEVAGIDTAFIVYSEQNYEKKLHSYFLHVNEEPCCSAQNIEGLAFPKQYDEQNLMELFDVLIRPWKEKLESLLIKKIVVIPSQKLSSVPFAALYDAEKEEFLIQSYAVSYAPSLRIFKYCNFRRKEAAELQSKGMFKALVVGNPKRLSGERDLQGADKEADYVAGILAEADVHLLKNEAATSDAVLEQLCSSNWVHIASHARFNLEDPPFGELLLSSCPQDREALNAHHSPSKGELTDDNLLVPSVEDYVLRALRSFRSNASFQQDREALNAHHSPSRGELTNDIVEGQLEIVAKVIVLSGCETGRGKACVEGTLGLCRSLHMVGAPSVVASLWEVDDFITEILMERFYVHLMKGLELTYALQEAMKSMVEEREESVGTSIFNISEWAPFFVSGANMGFLTK